MKKHSLIILALSILLLTGVQSIAKANQASTQAKDQSSISEKQVKEINFNEESTSNLNNNPIAEDEFVRTKSPLQRAVIREGFEHGKSRAYQLSLRESPSTLKQGYRKSSIGKRAPSEFSLYYEAYKRGYRQALSEKDIYQHPKDLGAESGKKAKHSGRKRPSSGFVRFQAIHNHPEWEGNEQAIQAYTRSFYAHYNSAKSDI